MPTTASPLAPARFAPCSQKGEATRFQRPSESQQLRHSMPASWCRTANRCSSWKRSRMDQVRATLE